MHNSKCKDVPGRTPRKTMTNSTAILSHLQASELIEVREWAKVLWVKAIVAGRVICRFVSKKIGTTKEMTNQEKCQKIQSAMEASHHWYEVKLWEKHGKVRAYIGKDNGRRVNDYGFIDLESMSVENVKGNAQHCALVAIKDCGF